MSCLTLDCIPSERLEQFKVTRYIEHPLSISWTICSFNILVLIKCKALGWQQWITGTVPVSLTFEGKKKRQQNINYKEHKHGTKNNEGIPECADSWRKAFWTERIVCIARSYTVSTHSKGVTRSGLPSHTRVFTRTVWRQPRSPS